MIREVFVNKDAIDQQIRHLRDVEKLSLRQIARQLGVDRKRVRRVAGGGPAMVRTIRAGLLDPFMALIGQWYQQYPKLKAKQVYERLKDYGYAGSYGSVRDMTREHRRPKNTAYHALVFHPGQEAQVDWFFFRHERLGMVAGFLYVLAWSRYAWGIFYQRTTFEFFLAGHLECYKHLGGVARSQRYDNLKSVVLRRTSTIEYNPQFMDFARFYGFSVNVCNPYSGNEKGRVERLIRDIRVFLAAESFVFQADLNRKFQVWLDKRNHTVHRSTGKTPKELLPLEKLVSLPLSVYPAKRIVPARVSKTALVELETNRYSTPSSCAGLIAELNVYPAHLEIWLSGQKVASHRRCFGREQLVQNPLHAQRLLDRSPQFRLERIKQLIAGMDPALSLFLDGHDNDEERSSAAYQIFQLIRNHSRETVLSAVRELVSMRNFKIRALRSLLGLPAAVETPAVWPKDARLMDLTYEERSLTDYDPDTGNI